MKFNFLFLQIFCVCIFVSNCAGENVKKSVDENRDDNGETNDETKDESMDVPVENESPNNVTCTRRQSSQIHEIRAAQHKQFPFVAAIMSDQNTYVCSGSVISNGMILTSAQCILQPISYALLNATKAKRDETTVALHIIKTEKFPTFSTSDSDYYVGLIYTEKHNTSIASKIKLSTYTSSQSVVDFEAIGFGLNSEVGQIKELQYIGIENRALPVMIESKDLLRGYFDCIDTKVVTCFKDTGGPAIFDNELLGVVVKGQNECIKQITSAYAINKKFVEILPTYTFKAWLDTKLKTNEDRENVALVTFPMKPQTRRRNTPVSSSINTYGFALGIYKINIGEKSVIMYYLMEDMQEFIINVTDSSTSGSAEDSSLNHSGSSKDNSTMFGIEYLESDFDYFSDQNQAND